MMLRNPSVASPVAIGDPGRLVNTGDEVVPNPFIGHSITTTREDRMDMKDPGHSL